MVLRTRDSVLNGIASGAAKGDLAFAVALSFVAIGHAVGWALGGPAAATRPVLGLGTAQRNIAAALVVGGQNFTDPNVVVMVVVVAIVSLLILLPLSRRLAATSTAR